MNKEKIKAEGEAVLKEKQERLKALTEYTGELTKDEVEETEIIPQEISNIRAFLSALREVKKEDTPLLKKEVLSLRSKLTRLNIVNGMLTSDRIKDKIEKTKERLMLVETLLQEIIEGD